MESGSAAIILYPIDLVRSDPPTLWVYHPTAGFGAEIDSMLLTDTRVGWFMWFSAVINQEMCHLCIRNEVYGMFTSLKHIQTDGLQSKAALTDCKNTQIDSAASLCTIAHFI